MATLLRQWSARRALGVALPALMVTVTVYELRDLDSRNFQCNQPEVLIAERLQYRKKRINEACEVYGYKPYSFYWYGDIRVDNIVWAKLPKVATTYMTALVLRRMMKNATLDCHPYGCYSMLKAITANDSRTYDEMIGARPNGPGGSLLIVRRPYSRLVSAFLDKIARNDNMRLWDQIKHISGRTNSTGPPTFSEFINFIIWEEDNGHIMDGHWNTQERMSRVCDRDFQYIVQLETMQDELPYVLRRLGLEKEARHPVNSRNSNSRQYDPVDYLNQLDDRQLARLDAIYRMDMILFNG